MTIVSVRVIQPKRRRKPTLARALKEADKAGKPVKRAVIYADHVELAFGESDTGDKDTEVESWINKHAH